MRPSTPPPVPLSPSPQVDPVSDPLTEADRDELKITGDDPTRYMTRTKISHKPTIGAQPNKVEHIGLGNLNVTTNYGNV